MKTLRLLLLALLYSGFSWGQNLNCEYRLTCKVIAPSGLTLRAAPNLNAPVLTYAPANSVVSACMGTYGKLTVEGISGNWRPVEYKNKQGYMFDGFLEVKNFGGISGAELDSLRKSSERLMSRADSLLVDSSANDPIPRQEASAPEPPEKLMAKMHPILGDATQLQIATETYNFCGDVQSIDPGLLWYGVFPDNEDKPTGLLSVEPVVLTVQLSKRRLSDNLEFDIITENEARSLFLLGVNRSLNLADLALPDVSNELRIRGRRIFPGQTVRLGGSSGLTLSATGAVVSGGDCPEINNYKLQASANKNGEKQEQNLLELLEGAGDCGMPELYWYGDLSGDGRPDLILVSVYETKNVFTLLTSRSTNNLLTREAVFTVETCN